VVRVKQRKRPPELGERCLCRTVGQQLWRAGHSHQRQPGGGDMLEKFYQQRLRLQLQVVRPGIDVSCGCLRLDSVCTITEARDLPTDNRTLRQKRCTTLKSGFKWRRYWKSWKLFVGSQDSPQRLLGGGDCDAFPACLPPVRRVLLVL